MTKHRYLPMTDQDQQEMLETIGVSSVDDLFSDIPEKYVLRAYIILKKQNRKQLC